MLMLRPGPCIWLEEVDNGANCEDVAVAVAGPGLMVDGPLKPLKPRNDKGGGIRDVVWLRFLEWVVVG